MDCRTLLTIDPGSEEVCRETGGSLNALATVPAKAIRALVTASVGPESSISMGFCADPGGYNSGLWPACGEGAAMGVALEDEAVVTGSKCEMRPTKSRNVLSVRALCDADDDAERAAGRLVV